VQFVDVLVRQAHPGPAEPPYASFEEKMEDAAAYQREERIPWPVVVDDLEGTVHQVYSGLADPSYLIDVDGRVAYYNMWTYSPVLHQAIEALLAQGGRGVVLGEGIDQTPHLMPSMTDGWKGLRRGLMQSYWDMETAAPGSASMMWLGHQMRPLLAQLTLRAKPLSPPTKLAMASLGAAMLATWLLRRRDRPAFAPPD
jgi:hypothetical protein